MNRSEKRRQKKRAQQRGQQRLDVSQLQNALNLAVQHHQRGRLPEAKSLYEQILGAEPNHPDALHLLGVVALQVGKSDTALELISKAARIAPDVADMHYNLGNAYKALGRFEDAAPCYQRAIRLNPDYGQAYFNLGQVLHQLGQLDEAEAALAKLVALAPDSAQTHFEMGNIHKAQSHFEAAVDSYQASINLEPGIFLGHANLAQVLHRLGKMDDAVSSYKTALSIAPDQALLHHNYANLLFDTGALTEAADSYRQALALDPNFAPAHCNLGRALDALGDANGFVHLHQAVTLDRDNDDYWAAFEDMVARLEFSHVDEPLLDDLSALLRRTTLRPHKLARAVVSALKCHPEFGENVRSILSADEMAIDRTATQFSKFPLFLEILKLCPLNDLDLERTSCRVRKAFLLSVMDDTVDARNLEFFSALAHQMFANEYMIEVGADEAEYLHQLDKQLATCIQGGDNPPPLHLIAMATYKPLHSCRWVEPLKDGVWPPAVAAVITLQIAEPLQERALRQEIKSLSIIDDQCSQAVRQQYEENPYPRWIKIGQPHRAIGFAASLKHLPNWQKPNDFTPANPPQVLIAGCGTGQQALDVAANLADAQVLAVDLSLSSLSYAKRKTQELGIANIEYVQGDILKLDALNRPFDMIESVGVLHHMAEPVTGWRVLVDLLRPNGLMKIGLYSELARKPILKARQLIAEKGYASTPEGIRAARSDIIRRIDAGDEAFAKILDITDFYTLSECRDLIFHVQEHRFDLLQIEDILQKLNLKFLGFELNQPSVKAQFEKEHPQPGGLTNLAHWHEFESKHPNTFKGMYQFWCQKNA